MSRLEELLKRKQVEISRKKPAWAQLLADLPSDERRIVWPRDKFHILAEYKRSSLTAGVIRQDLPPAEAASAYRQAGVSAVSVLTEPNYFSGSLDDITAIRRCMDTPILQKDFVLDELQIAEAKYAGADFVLLIARLLEPSRLRALHRFSAAIGLNAIVEITDEDDLRKVDFSIEYLGVNSRDLSTLEIDTSKFSALRKALPDAFLIAESGITNRELLAEIIDLGYHGALIGEHFMRCADPGKEAASFVNFSSAWKKNSGVTRVKICGITNERDSRLSVDYGASALGFIFAESPRSVSPEALQAFRNGVPPSVLTVGVFRDRCTDEINDTMQRFDFDVAQIYDRTETKKPCWQAITVQQASEVSGKVSNRKVLWDVKSDPPAALWTALSQHDVFALAGGLSSANVGEAIRTCTPRWVDVARGVESKPGIKDAAKTSMFIHAVRTALGVNG